MSPTPRVDTGPRNVYYVAMTSAPTTTGEQAVISDPAYGPSLRIRTPVREAVEVGNRPGCYGVEMTIRLWTEVLISRPAWARDRVHLLYRHYRNGICVNDLSAGGLENAIPMYERVLGVPWDSALLDLIPTTEAAA